MLVKRRLLTQGATCIQIAHTICNLISYILITEEILLETFCEMTVEFYHFIFCSLILTSVKKLNTPASRIPKKPILLLPEGLCNVFEIL